MKVGVTINKILLSIRKNNIATYVKNYLMQMVPGRFYQQNLAKKLSIPNGHDLGYIRRRLDYYNKLSHQKEVGEDAVCLSEMKKIKGPSAYYFDTYEHTRYFRQSLTANLLFKDVIHVPDVPTLQKSRPIGDNNENAVILKMDKKRHFLFIKDPYKFSQKKDILIGRSSIDMTWFTFGLHFLRVS
ncbi:hypothetical protein [Dyadobacter sp. CY312]|uniref:hypothetical protein n=1 Tax=Dyadobacter sp. CY312 TaxID=2907303 RepID=UPI001F2D51CD|nr:hypothetical protein [Dyadobacter sp. CY312]MCE7042616.1 hypothetical protein [Dyadobacter sp. CY312]